MFGLEEKHINFIRNTLNEYFPTGKYYVFGSRAKGTNKEYSDIDIAVELKNEKISADTLGKILMFFNDSTLPYEVDIVDLKSIDENFKNLIINDLIELK